MVIKPPKGYRLLEYGEFTKKGDIYAIKLFAKWRPGAFEDVKVRPKLRAVYARKINTKPTIDPSYLWE